jgi:hypothetical protein
LAWLAHPITLTALVLLVVNDHLLKEAYPGVVTGKLSDVAGLVLAPPLLASLAGLTIRRPRADVVAAVSTVVVALGFAWAKTTAAGAAAASAAWSIVAPGSVVLVDPTDLLALCALGLSWYTFRAASRRPVAGRVVRLVRVCVVLPAAMLSVAATSQVWTEVAVDVIDVDGTIVLGEASVSASRVDGELDNVTALAASRDGETWSTDPSIVDTSEVQAAVSSHAPTPQSCRPTDPQDCYRVVPGRLAIEHRGGNGDWTVAWQVSTRERAALIENGESYVRDLYTCRSVLVRDFGRDHVVIAACGRDGFVRRGTDGVWQRIGFPPDREPTDLASISPGIVDLDSTMAGGVAALLALIFGLLAVRPKTGSPAAVWTLGVLSICGLLPLAVRFSPDLWGLGGFVIVAAELVVQLALLVAFVAVCRHQRRLRWDVVCAAIVTGLATSLLPYLAFQGLVPPDGWIWPAAAVLAATGIAGAVATARRRPVRRQLASQAASSDRSPLQ